VRGSTIDKTKVGVDGIVALNAVERPCRGIACKCPLACAMDEARHHIFSDLVPALVTSECGSDDDWQKVHNVIESCTGQTVNGYVPGRAASPHLEREWLEPLRALPASCSGPGPA
jgi:hypothetical protein